MPTYTFGEIVLKIQNFIIYSFVFQIIHILVHWNPHEKWKQDP
jgi:hypothetical protein